MPTLLLVDDNQGVCEKQAMWNEEKTQISPGYYSQGEKIIVREKETNLKDS